MVVSENPFLSDAVSAALDWWRDAGVDHHFLDDPVDWLTKAEERPDVVASAAVQSVPAFPPKAESPQTEMRASSGGTAVSVLDPAQWPQDLDQFRTWWLREPALDNGRVDRRVASRGPKGAPVMLVLADPEAEDSETLLSGPLGRFAAHMLTAMGIAQDQACIATVFPRNTPMPDWQSAKDQGFGVLLAHHIALAAPRRVILLGGNILPLLGHAPANSPAILTEFDHGQIKVPLLATRELALLRDRPQWKAAFWAAWLNWEVQL